MRFTVRCRNGSLHTDDYTMSHYALSRRAAPRCNAPGRGSAMRHRSKEHRDKQRCFAVPHRPCTARMLPGLDHNIDSHYIDGRCIEHIPSMG
jgi:hypothetical protein